MDNQYYTVINGQVVEGLHDAKGLLVTIELYTDDDGIRRSRINWPGSSVNTARHICVRLAHDLLEADRWAREHLRANA